MDRKEFLITLGISTAAVCATCYLASCSSDDSGSPTAPPAPQNVDFTIDISQSENQPLNTVGGSLIKNGIILARTGTTSVAAVAAACTHQGFILVYEHSASRFHCNNHGSNFALTGSVINGPATQPLTRYNTTLNGNNLRVFS